jgi:hypothetical protein
MLFPFLKNGCIVLGELRQQRSICYGWVCHMCMACTSVHCTRMRSLYRCLEQELHSLQVVLHPEFGAPPKGILAWTWVTLILASAGLVFLYKTTTADPGFLPCGVDERVGKEKVRREVIQSIHSPSSPASHRLISRKQVRAPLLITLGPMVLLRGAKSNRVEGRVLCSLLEHTPLMSCAP